jgi:D-sedoheptulose 7-phosphate isomerase
MSFFSEYFEGIGVRLRDVEFGVLDRLAAIFCEVGERGRKVILVGNGGSAAMASHVAVDLTKVAGVRAVNFNEADLLTCFANDYGYEHWVEKALEFYADDGDVVVLISSSGRSPNIINGAKAARMLRTQLITLSGFDAGNPLRALGDLNLWTDSRAYNIVEMTHHIWLLAAVDKIINDKEKRR